MSGGSCRHTVRRARGGLGASAGSVVGVVLGSAVGRQVAASLGVPPAVVLPLVPLLVLLLVVALVLRATSVAPMERASRVHPGRALARG